MSNYWPELQIKPVIKRPSPGEMYQTYFMETFRIIGTNLQMVAPGVRVTKAPFINSLVPGGFEWKLRLNNSTPGHE